MRNELTEDEKMHTSFTAKSSLSSKLQERIIPVLVSFVGTLIALFPSNPNNMTLPSRDSGVFLYVGWRFLRGDIPYRDVWDHKPPLIYFIDALGLTLTPDSLWGVWLLQGVFIFFTFFLLYKLLDGEFGAPAALGGTIAFATGLLTILARGNVTEEYPLLFQVLCFLLFVRAYRQDFPIRTSFWMGILGALAFLFKQTTIGVWIAFAIILLAVRIYQRRLPLQDLLAHLTGWLIPIFIIGVYFASQNALTDFWEQAFLYNFTYIGKHEGIRRLIPVFAKGFLYLQNGWLLDLAIVGWFTGLAYIWQKLKGSFGQIHPLILIAVIDLPIEVALITISGRSILHYYLTPLPVMAILTGTLIYGMPILMEKVKSHSMQRIKKWVPALLLAVIAAAQIGQASYYPEYVRALRENDRVAVIDYIQGNTEENDKVLIIGAESAVNFLARREAPTRYVYQYPLALLGRRPMFEEYFNQILDDKPVLIIDTRGRTQLTEKLYQPLQKRSQIVRDGVKYLGENYEQVAQFGEWAVYRLVEKP
jgi:hypothetical protein